MTSTCSTTPEDQFTVLEVSNHNTQLKLEEYHGEVVGIRNDITALSNAIAQLSCDKETRDQERGSINHGHSGWYNGHNENHGGIQGRFSRIDFPRFTGEDPTGWIYQAKQFFEYQGTTPPDRILLASFHLQCDALQWYKWYHRIHLHVPWQEFTQALCVRFGPFDYEDFDEALSSLWQADTVREYQTRFERLASQVQGWPENALLGCYVGGLREEIWAEVKLFRPTTLLHATSLARLQEDELSGQRWAPTKLPLLPSPPIWPQL